jgi:SAM-dependent methyltransferase
MSEAARSFDASAEEYERTRPDYPGAVLDLLPLDAGAEVVDVGAGTGKLTRVLARRYRRVIAVEPLDRMRAVLERVVPQAEALAGNAEAIPLPDGSADGAFAAQAFHWFDYDHAIPELARVVRPGGVLAVVWNGPDESRTDPRPRPFLDVLESLHEEAPFRRNPPPPYEELLARHPFVNVREAAIPHDHVIDRAGLLENARTISWIATRPDADRVIERLGELLPEGTYAVPNLAHLMWAERT